MQSQSEEPSLLHHERNNNLKGGHSSFLQNHSWQLGINNRCQTFAQKKNNKKKDEKKMKKKDKDKMKKMQQLATEWDTLCGHPTPWYTDGTIEWLCWGHCNKQRFQGCHVRRTSPTLLNLNSLPTIQSAAPSFMCSSRGKRKTAPLKLGQHLAGVWTSDVWNAHLPFSRVRKALCRGWALQDFRIQYLELQKHAVPCPQPFHTPGVTPLDSLQTHSKF